MNLIVRKPNRLPHFDYSTSACYFVTICTFKRENLFGYVEDEKVVLNEAGKIVQNSLLRIPIIYTDIILDEYVVMPNHIHFLLINNSDGEDGNRKDMRVCKIINQFKGTCTKSIRELLNMNVNVWQRSFYDRVVRNDKELIKIREYIVYNPLKWDLERNNPENLLI